jgi:membrane-associated PAP2 superfamily phosphatase
MLESASAEWQVYLVSPGRRYLPWFLFGPFIAGMLLLVIFSEPKDRAIGWIPGGFFLFSKPHG